MPEYIEREALIKKLNEAPAYFDSGDIRYGLIIAMDITEKQPATDVVPKSKYDRAINTLNAHGIKIEED